MNWLVDTITPAPIWNAAQTRTGQESNASWNHARLVRNDVTEQIAGHHDTIQGPGVLDHQHCRAINQVVTDLELWELLGHNLCHDLTPQPRSRQHVRLIQRPNWQRRFMFESEVCGQSRNPLNLRARIWLRVPCSPIAIVLLARTKVDAASELSDDVEVGATADFSFQRRDVDKGIRREVAGAQVAVGAHFFAKGKDALFWTDGASAPFWTSDCAEEDGVGGFGCGESFCGQG